MTTCEMCGWQPDRQPAHEWTIEADASTHAAALAKLKTEGALLVSGNWLKGNGKNSFRYRAYRRFFETALADQLNAIPRANKYRVGIITRLYGKGRRKYDDENMSWGCKPVVDTLKAFAVIIDDSPNAFGRHYRQERSGDGVDRFTVRLMEY